VISDIITDPASPSAGVGTHVQASVVDTSGPIASVDLAWGTSSGSLANNISMELLSDSTYRTMTQIPGQAAGASIYYQVQTVGASSNSNSAILSYSIPGGGGGAPTILSVGEMSDSTLLVFFSEPVEETSAETPGNYTVGALTAVNAVRDPAQTSQVMITVRSIPPGSRTLTVNGVADLSANVAYGITRNFTYIDVSIPPGYYDGTAGLTGSALRVALHNIIKNHTSISYSAALTAFGTTDVKPNGKIWDMYSDIPGGTPPYEYNVGQTGQGASEGFGYNREHSFPQSWFNGVSPTYSDLWNLYPTDAYVNGMRANYPYGEVAVATKTSLNGCRVGSSATPGYSGTVFEPIAPYRGDLARGMFYIATRYFNQDGSWPGSPAANGSQWLPWAADQFVAWSSTDPVSWKERLRNGAVYTYQNNRNPFVDHPEFVTAIYDSNATTGIGPGLAARTIRLRQNAPNPFTSRTAIAFDLVRRAPVSLRIYDVQGRQVRVLLDGGALEAGTHSVEWDGRDATGAVLNAGLYLCRLDAGAEAQTKRIVFTR
jgi:endonuclease I